MDDKQISNAVALGILKAVGVLVLAALCLVAAFWWLTTDADTQTFALIGGLGIVGIGAVLLFLLQPPERRTIDCASWYEGDRTKRS